MTARREVVVRTASRFAGQGRLPAGGVTMGILTSPEPWTVAYQCLPPVPFPRRQDRTTVPFGFDTAFALSLMGRPLVVVSRARAVGSRAPALTLRRGGVRRPKPARSSESVLRRRILWVIGRWPSIYRRLRGYTRVPVAVFGCDRRRVASFWGGHAKALYGTTASADLDLENSVVANGWGRRPGLDSVRGPGASPGAPHLFL